MLGLFSILGAMVAPSGEQTSHRRAILVKFIRLYRLIDLYLLIGFVYRLINFLDFINFIDL